MSERPPCQPVAKACSEKCPHGQSCALLAVHTLYHQFPLCKECSATGCPFLCEHSKQCISPNYHRQNHIFACRVCSAEAFRSQRRTASDATSTAPGEPSPTAQNQDAPEVGRKETSGKLQWSLLPLDAVREVIKVLEFGAKKYARDNWKKVPDARRAYYEAAMRHITAWYDGEDADPETGLHHMAHAACDVLFLVSLFPVGLK